jgi:hypothetical protein
VVFAQGVCQRQKVTLGRRDPDVLSVSTATYAPKMVPNCPSSRYGAIHRCFDYGFFVNRHDANAITRYKLWMLWPFPLGDLHRPSLLDVQTFARPSNIIQT